MCAFINASAEYSGQTDQPHILAKLHKQQVLAYLEKICTDAKFKQPFLADINPLRGAAPTKVRSLVAGATNLPVGAEHRVLNLPLPLFLSFAVQTYPDSP